MNLASDLDGLFSDILADLAVPTVPTRGEDCGNGQVPDLIHVSHTSHVSHSEIGGSKIFDPNPASVRDFLPDGSRATSSYLRRVGNVGTVGNRPETLAGSTASDFPLPSSLVGKEEEEWEMPGLSAEPPQPPRSDWWTGPAMAEADRLAPPAGAPLSISPADVCAGVQRELRALAALGVTGPEAEQRALAITRAKVGNSPALAERQASTGRCHCCEEPLTEAAPVIAVLNPGGAPLHLHAGCHDAYRARRQALVVQIMEAAGYGAQATGEAA